MGEGWSDFFAALFQMVPHSKRNDRILIGSYVKGRGIRGHPYSSNFDINPLTWKYSQTYKQTHAVGTIWCQMLLVSVE